MAARHSTWGLLLMGFLVWHVGSIRGTQCDLLLQLALLHVCYSVLNCTSIPSVLLVFFALHMFWTDSGSSG